MTGRPFTQQLLTIQSAVMTGAVGNDAALPVYSHFNLKASRLDTVRLAAHPGFGTGFADITRAGALRSLLADFTSLAGFSALQLVQTGYFGSAEQIPPVADFIAESQAMLGQLIYVLDPVLGDGGRLYVDRNIHTALQSRLLPLADIITPNAFELGLLSGHEISSTDNAVTAARTLLGGRLARIFVTGIARNDSQIADLLITADDVQAYTHPRKDRGVSGSGDVLSALMVAHLLGGADYPAACAAASRQTAAMIDAAPSALGLEVKDWLWQQPR